MTMWCRCWSTAGHRPCWHSTASRSRPDRTRLPLPQGEGDRGRGWVLAGSPLPQPHPASTGYAFLPHPPHTLCCRQPVSPHDPSSPHTRRETIAGLLPRPAHDARASVCFGTTGYYHSPGRRPAVLSHRRRQSLHARLLRLNCSAPPNFPFAAVCATVTATLEEPIPWASPPNSRSSPPTSASTGCRPRW